VLAGSGRDDESGARVWDLGTGELLAAFPRDATCTALAPDGKTFSVSHNNGTPEVADAATGKVVRAARGEPLLLGSLAYGLGGKLLIGAGWMDQSIHFWEAGTLKPLPPIDAFPKGMGNRSLAVTPDGARLITAGPDGVVRVWDLATRKEVCHFTAGELRNWMVALTLATDGRFIATGLTREPYGFGRGGGGISTDVRVWDLATGKTRLTIAGPKDGANCLAFSPDGRVVAVGSEDRVARVYELATGMCRCEFRGHNGPVTAIAFSPDGRRLLTGGADTTVLVWDLTRPLPGAVKPSDAAAWADLHHRDAARADQAMRYFVASPETAVAQFKKHLKAEPGSNSKRIRELIEQLGAPTFAEREAAQAELGRIGAAAIPALREAIRSTVSAEVVRRANELVDMLARLTLAGEPLRQARAVEVLERIGSADARAILTDLAKGAPSARLTQEAKQALERSERQ